LLFRKKKKTKKTSREVYINDNNYDEEGGYEVVDEDDEENELKLYSDAREERLRKKKQRKKRMIAVIILLLIVGFIYINWGTLSPPALAESVQNFFSSFGKSKYPVEFDEGSLKAAVPVGSNIGVLTDTSFLIYSQNGDQLAVRPHSINNPAAVSGGGKALIYDRGGKHFCVETRYSEPYSSSTLYDITTAAMGQNGDFAIVTDSENYLSELNVYDDSYKNIFKWQSSQGRILSAAISPDGKKLAAVVIGARNGSMFSDIYIFNLDSQTPVAVKKYDNALLYSLAFKDNDRIAAVGDSKAVFLFASGDQASVYSYGGSDLDCSFNGDGPCVLVFKKSGTKSTIVSLDGEGKLLGKTDINVSQITAVSNGNGKTVVVSNNKIIYTEDNCSNPTQISASMDVLAAISMKNHAYIFGTQSIGSYNLN
jgi:tricorn protease-like protein